MKKTIIKNSKKDRSSLDEQEKEAIFLSLHYKFSFGEIEEQQYENIICKKCGSSKCCYRNFQ